MQWSAKPTPQDRETRKTIPDANTPSTLPPHYLILFLLPSSPIQILYSMFINKCKQSSTAIIPPPYFSSYQFLAQDIHARLSRITNPPLEFLLIQPDRKRFTISRHISRPPRQWNINRDEKRHQPLNDLDRVLIHPESPDGVLFHAHYLHFPVLGFRGIEPNPNIDDVPT